MKPCVRLMGYRPDWTPRAPVLFGVWVRRGTKGYIRRDGTAPDAPFILQCANPLCGQLFATRYAAQRFCSPQCVHLEKNTTPVERAS
jgi:hypothetical protein